MSDAPESEQVHPVSRLFRFIEAASFPRRLTLALGILFLALAGADVVHHRHALFAWEGLWGFHAWFGFVAFSAVVLMGWPLRRLLSRPESYYEDDEGA